MREEAPTGQIAVVNGIYNRQYEKACRYFLTGEISARFLCNLQMIFI